MTEFSMPQLIYPIICDDIRQEVGGKSSLMGVYTDRIVFAKFPASMPKLCFQIHLRGCPREFTLDVYLHSSGDRQVLMENFHFQAQDDLQDAQRNLVLNISRVGAFFREPGPCQLVMIFNKDESLRAEFTFEAAFRRDVH